jgi:hypothetical protein
LKTRGGHFNTGRKALRGGSYIEEEALVLPLPTRGSKLPAVVSRSRGEPSGAVGLVLFSIAGNRRPHA